MQIQGVVISYTPSTKVNKQGGGTYDGWELVYRDGNNKVESVTKPVQSLKFNPKLKQGLAELNPNDQFTMVLEKENGFWNPKSVQSGFVDVQDVAEPKAAAKDGNRAETPVRSGKVTGSNYETPEERAKRQVIISRQACLNTAVGILASGKGAMKVEEVLEVAKALDAFVFEGLEDKAKEYKEVFSS